ncbi:methyltransferase domain-containing protein [candidate division KSB1 bacterium]|nr:methyltransferase domain-containing protein [candidate division KSB1 bacterium]
MSEENVNLETTRCPLCGENQHEKVIKACDIVCSLEYFHIVRCNLCGFKYTNPRPPFEGLAAFYGENYYSYRSPSVNLKKGPVTRGRFLDFGCGAGEYLVQMHNQGWECFGVDIPGPGVERARELGFVVKDAQQKRVDYKDEFFDQIRANQVLEHLSDLQSIVAELYRCLKKEGTLEITVPNIESFDARIWNNHWRHLDLPRHLNHFSPQSLERLFEMNGFKIKTLFTYSTPLFERNLHYLKGCFTSWKSLKHHYRNSLSGSLKASWQVFEKIIHYARHPHQPMEGQMIAVYAEKQSGKKRP